MKILFQICLLVFFSFAAAQTAYSCSCFGIPNKDEIGITDMIFTGKVVEITQDMTYVPPKIESVAPKKESETAFPIIILERVNKTKRFLVKFKVDKKFKGVKGGEITLVQFEEEFSYCSGLLFAKGKKYLVYASKIKNELTGGGVCSRTENFDKNSEDYKELLEMRLKA